MKDTDFEMAVEIKNNKDNDNLMQSINCYLETREGVYEERVYREKNQE